MAGRALVALALAVGLAMSACTLIPRIERERCPRTIAEATSVVPGDDTAMGAGYVIRFVPSLMTEFRGYDVNITRSLAGDLGETVFLRVETEVPGISRGAPVLFVAQRDPSEGVFLPGNCVPLVRITEDSLDGSD